MSYAQVSDAVCLADCQFPISVHWIEQNEKDDIEQEPAIKDRDELNSRLEHMWKTQESLRGTMQW